MVHGRVFRMIRSILGEFYPMNKAIAASVFVVVMLAACAAVASAQCPKVEVYGPTDVPAGSPLTFSAAVTGGAAKDVYKYEWSVSAGKITSGQGTTAIKVDTTGVGGEAITATLDVKGAAEECHPWGASTTSVTAVVMPTKIDEFGAIKAEDEMARLDNFTNELQNRPVDTAYVLVYAGRKSKPGETAAPSSG
jgi:hypothetical protein